MTDPWAPPPKHDPATQPAPQVAPSAGSAAAAASATSSASAASSAPTAAVPTAAPPQSGAAPAKRSFFRDPLAIVLVVVIVVALTAAGVVGVELYARHRADEVVASATACVVQDSASASFGASPFLLQLLSKHFDSISIETAGNQIRDAKGMKAKIDIDDVRLADTGNSKGTIGSLDATITWTAEGIKQTLQKSIPVVGSFITGAETNPSDGTIELKGLLGSIVTKPGVVDGGISLQVQKLTGLGFTLPRETVQPALDAFTGQLTKNYPLGIHADSVQVNDTGVISKFSTKNASIPVGGQDPCFAGV